jgi:hypothetical protein
MNGAEAPALNRAGASAFCPATRSGITTAMADPAVLTLQSRFILHLAAALRGRLAYADVPVANEFVQLDTILSAASLDPSAARATMQNVLAGWDRQQLQVELADDVRVLMTQCLEALSQAVERLGSANPDEFVNATFRCRDRIVSLNLMLRAGTEE